MFPMPRPPGTPSDRSIPSLLLVAGTIFGMSSVLTLGPAASATRGEEPEAVRRAHDELHLKCAEARLHLAELDLEKATLLERQGAGKVVSEHDWRRLRARVGLLRELVAVSRQHPHGTGIEGQRARARIAVKVAEEDLEEARGLHDRQPDAFTELAVRRAEAKAEIARLRLAIWEDPANVPSLIDEMQMQIDQLTDHVLDLLDQVDNARITDSLRP